MTPTLTDDQVRCNSCGMPMRRAGASPPTWTCICGQVVAWSPLAKRWTQVILPRLYPSSMTPSMHHEWADHWGSQEAFWARLQVLAGHEPPSYYDERAGEIAEAVQKHKAEHPLGAPPLSFWRRLLRRPS